MSLLLSAPPERPCRWPRGFGSVLLLLRGSTGGLAHLLGLKGLRELSLEGTKVTQAGIKKLKRALPSCEISWKRGLPAPDLSRSQASVVGARGRTGAEHGAAAMVWAGCRTRPCPGIAIESGERSCAGSRGAHSSEAQQSWSPSVWRWVAGSWPAREAGGRSPAPRPRTAPGDTRTATPIRGPAWSVSRLPTVRRGTLARTTTAWTRRIPTPNRGQSVSRRSTSYGPPRGCLCPMDQRRVLRRRSGHC